MFKAKAYANIALTKYWGKKDEYYHLPFYDTISFTMDTFYTEVTVVENKESVEDRFYIQGELVSEHVRIRLIDYLKKVRLLYQVPPVIIDSTMSLYLDIGMASSASFHAALAVALNDAFQLGLDAKMCSRLARLGSGSAARSIYGGFSIWKQGSDLESLAYPIHVDWPDFRMIVLFFDKSPKPMSSREAMKRAIGNTNYDTFVKKSIQDNEDMLQGILTKDIHRVGQVAENNACRLHEMIEETGIIYLSDKAKAFIKDIKEKRKASNLPMYVTMDAGNTLFLLTTAPYVDMIITSLKLKDYTVLKEGHDAKGEC